jgi:hypothetical protein
MDTYVFANQRAALGKTTVGGTAALPASTSVEQPMTRMSRAEVVDVRPGGVLPVGAAGWVRVGCR